MRYEGYNILDLEYEKIASTGSGRPQHLVLTQSPGETTIRELKNEYGVVPVTGNGGYCQFMRAGHRIRQKNPRLRE